jgi:crotonobetainyl-CoA hydratase
VTSSTTAAGDPVLLERVETALVITINRPAVRNAVDQDVSRRIAAALTEADADPAVRAVVVTGAGDVAFSAGADLKALARGEPPRPPEIDHLGFAGLVEHGIAKPLVAAVNGLALGGGLEICLACDLAVASSTATFGLPEVSRGIAAGGGGAVRLPVQLPQKVALRMLLTGEPVTAAEAARWGLVNEVVHPDRLLDVTLDLVTRIAANAPLAVAATKRIAHRGRAGARVEEAAAWAVSRAESSALMLSDDAREGPRAFAEKRPPRWTGT